MSLPFQTCPGGSVLQISVHITTIYKNTHVSTWEMGWGAECIANKSATQVAVLSGKLENLDWQKELVNRIIVLEESVLGSWR
jgi:hypothetical protein